eukprot:192500-Amphidinium_carterae.1
MHELQQQISFTVFVTIEWCFISSNSLNSASGAIFSGAHRKNANDATQSPAYDIVAGGKATYSPRYGRADTNFQFMPNSIAAGADRT